MITAEEAFRAKSKAEGQLTAALTKTRQIKRKVNAHGSIDQEPETVRKEDDTHSSASSKAAVMVPPRPPIQTGHQEEISQVRVLDIPHFDATRQFPGLAKQKIVKKERHMKAIDDFTYLLDVVAEGIEQDVLNLSRSMREALEKVDESLKHSYDLLQSPPFLVPKSEEDLKDLLQELKRTIVKRLRIVDAFGEDLDGLEKKRADKVGSELKALVDRLIAIAHQLPDEIEKIVETNIFDLNSVLTTNRKSHAALLGMLRKLHVEKMAECIGASCVMIKHLECLMETLLVIASHVPMTARTTCYLFKRIKSSASSSDMHSYRSSAGRQVMESLQRQYKTLFRKLRT
jgi:hypothetical protein